MKKKHASVDELLATYSTHIKENFHDPEGLRTNLKNLLGEKKKRMTIEEYTVSLERNVIFLHDLTLEGEALLEILVEQSGDDTDGKVDTGGLLVEIEEKVRKSTGDRYRTVFEEQNAAELGELASLRGGEGDLYLERLEFIYSYYMTYRLFLHEFFNLLDAVRAEYEIEGIDDAVGKHITNHVKVTVNYYLGNISVGEIVDGERPRSSKDGAGEPYA